MSESRRPRAPVARGETLRAALARFDVGQALVVAYSGGADSVALLHALVEARRDRLQTLRALHVDHAMHPASADWARHCARVCAGLGVALESVRVEVHGIERRGPEAAAREARWAAFARSVRAGETLCTAHHADDQVETVLLALARGAGPAGLSGMPARARLGEGHVARPLLDVPGEDLRAHAREVGLEWVADPSNDDPRLARTALRRVVLPALRSHWPGVDASVRRAASHQGRIAGLLEALADLDLRGLAGRGPNTLSRLACAALGRDRLANALRRWIAGQRLPVPASRHLEHVVHDVIESRQDAEPVVRWPGAEVRRHGDELHAMRPLPAPTTGAVRWSGGSPLALAHGLLALEPATGRGISASLLAGHELVVRFREGGERCRPAGRAHGQTLRRLFQERGVAPWERDRVPLIYLEGDLVAVADLWVCAGFEAGPGAPGLAPSWRPANG